MPGPAETAYLHRHATFVIGIGTHGKPGTEQSIVQDLPARTRTMHRTLSRDLETSAASVDFPEPDLRNWQSAHYGDNYRRLTEVKHRYDTTGLFRYEQAAGG